MSQAGAVWSSSSEKGHSAAVIGCSIKEVVLKGCSVAVTNENSVVQYFWFNSLEAHKRKLPLTPLTIIL